MEIKIGGGRKGGEERNRVDDGEEKMVGTEEEMRSV